MRRIREILRLYLDCKLSHRQIAQSVGVSRSTVAEYLARASGAGLPWPLPHDLDDAALEKMLYPPPLQPPARRPEPDWNYVNSELKRKGVTLLLLWQEYKEQHPEGYQYSQFCDRYRQWRNSVNVTMRLPHHAGEKTFSDFAGAKLKVIDQETGEVRFAHLFVTALGASSYTYAEAFWTEGTESWCLGHVHGFEYFGGAPKFIVPDNPKTTVTRACPYEPELNPTFQEMAAHYGCAVLPARVRRPRDKAKVESAVGVATRWIVARLRNGTFFSLTELNRAIRQLLEDMNTRPFKKLPGSRRTSFESLDGPALKPLPGHVFEIAEIRKARVHIDYHVEFDGHWYSVPYQLARKEVEVRATTSTIEILFRGKRVASHVRSPKKGSFTTVPEHMPKAHRQYLEWSPSRMIQWASSFGPATKEAIERILESKPHPEQGYRRCLGILKLGKLVGSDRLECACQRALATGALSYRSIKSILEHGLDRLPLPAAEFPTQLRIHHENIRGASYFIQKEDSDAHTANN
jgi:transposase